MTFGGWLNLVLSVGFVTVLFIYCLQRVLRGAVDKPEHLARVEPVDEEQVDER